MTDTTILQTTNLSIGYRQRRQADRVVAADLDLSLTAGKLVCLLGPNGVGKSTLMRTLAGMQPALDGRILLDGEPVSSLRPSTLARKLSVVLTEPVNAGLMTSYALVALGRYPYTNWRGSMTAEDEAVVRKAIESVGAVPLANRPVSELSDGERQKVMIARALAQEPKIMLLDEPTAYLDLPRRVEMMRILRNLAHDGEHSILLSTHDLDLALRNADVIWLMVDGRIQVGAPEDLVLSGAFASAFAAEGVTFDPVSGSFQITRREKGTVDVIGEGVKALWTVRALERHGYVVNLGQNGSTVQIVCQNGHWELAHESGEANYSSLGELTAALQEVPGIGSDKHSQRHYDDKNPAD
jgi:iron complex transport system ATP-binding protein